MKNLVLLVAVVALSFSTLIAQPNHQSDKNRSGHEDKSANRIEYLTIVLDLTSEQASKIGQLQTTHAASIKAIKAQYRPIMDKMRAEMKEIRDASEGNDIAAKEKMKAVREKYSKELDPMKQSMKSERDNLQNQTLQVLNPAQAEKFNKLQALKQDGKNQIRKGHHNNGKDNSQLERKQLDKK